MDPSSFVDIIRNTFMIQYDTVIAAIFVSSPS